MRDPRTLKTAAAAASARILVGDSGPPRMLPAVEGPHGEIHFLTLGVDPDCCEQVCLDSTAPLTWPRPPAAPLPLRVPVPPLEAPISKPVCNLYISRVVLMQMGCEWATDAPSDTVAQKTEPKVGDVRTTPPHPTPPHHTTPHHITPRHDTPLSGPRQGSAPP